MNVLTFNGLRFLQLSSKDHHQAARFHGFYQANENGAHLYKLNGELEAYVVRNPRQGYFVVTAWRHEGRVRYLFSTCSTTEEWLGIEGMKLLALDATVKAMSIEAEVLNPEVA